MGEFERQTVDRLPRFKIGVEKLGVRAREAGSTTDIVSEVVEKARC
jgi:hypothetical protein